MKKICIFFIVMVFSFMLSDCKPHEVRGVIQLFKKDNNPYRSPYYVWFRNYPKKNPKELRITPFHLKKGVIAIGGVIYTNLYQKKQKGFKSSWSLKSKRELEGVFAKKLSKKGFHVLRTPEVRKRLGEDVYNEMMEEYEDDEIKFDKKAAKKDGLKIYKRTFKVDPSWYDVLNAKYLLFCTITLDAKDAKYSTVKYLNIDFWIYNLKVNKLVWVGEINSYLDVSKLPTLRDQFEYVTGFITPGLTSKDFNIYDEDDISL